MGPWQHSVALAAFRTRDHNTSNPARQAPFASEAALVGVADDEHPCVATARVTGRTRAPCPEGATSPWPGASESDVVGVVPTATLPVVGAPQGGGVTAVVVLGRRAPPVVPLGHETPEAVPMVASYSGSSS